MYMHYGADEADSLTQQRSWVAHAKGQLAMLTSRQPQDFRSGRAHQLFVDCRYILVSALNMVEMAAVQLTTR
jgi:hypothetical protein